MNSSSKQQCGKGTSHSCTDYCTDTRTMNVRSTIKQRLCFQTLWSVRVSAYSNLPRIVSSRKKELTPSYDSLEGENCRGKTPEPSFIVEPGLIEAEDKIRMYSRSTHQYIILFSQLLPKVLIRTQINVTHISVYKRASVVTFRGPVVLLNAKSTPYAFKRQQGGQLYITIVYEIIILLLAN